MNKDVIYIEPEDDITDIITKIEKSKQKIVAVVTPKKAGVFRSIVNIRLIAKASAAAKKTAVLVTTDPSVVKLAAAARLPVTKDLQSKPTIPEISENAEETAVTEEIVEKTAKDGETEIVAEEVKDTEEVNPENDNQVSDESETKTKEEAKKKAPEDKKAKREKKKSDNQIIAWMQEHKKLLIGGGVGAMILILILIWAFVIAPAATITIGIRTTTSNFSENVTFTENLADENAAEGKFYLEQKKVETQSEVEFEATGTKNVGEKATGDVVAIVYFNSRGSVVIDQGATFSLGGLTYLADERVVIAWDGKISSCENADDTVEEVFRCRLSARVDVTASAPGTQYNIAPSSTGWSTSAGVGVYSDKAMEGGTDKNITVVQQSDVETALKKMETSSEAANKERLFETIDEGSFIVESSLKQSIGDPVSTPAVGEEVKDGQKAKLTVTTTNTVYVIDKTKVEEFIKEKAKLAENYKIYSMNDPFIENFIKTDGNYVGKLKTSFVSGPEITESEVVETVRGEGLGTAQHNLKDKFNGISTITIDTSFPWVNTIPDDENKITVMINVEE